VEGPKSSESKKHELENLRSKQEVKGSLQEGPSFRVNYPQVSKSLADKEAEFNFRAKILEFMDPMKHELKRSK
jgi:hypothetical protein